MLVRRPVWGGAAEGTSAGSQFGNVIGTASGSGTDGSTSQRLMHNCKTRTQRPLFFLSILSATHNPHLGFLFVGVVLVAEVSHSPLLRIPLPYLTLRSSRTTYRYTPIVPTGYPVFRTDHTLRCRPNKNQTSESVSLTFSCPGHRSHHTLHTAPTPHIRRIWPFGTKPRRSILTPPDQLPPLPATRYLHQVHHLSFATPALAATPHQEIVLSSALCVCVCRHVDALRRDIKKPRGVDRAVPLGTFDLNSNSNSHTPRAFSLMPS